MKHYAIMAVVALLVIVVVFRVLPAPAKTAIVGA